MGLIWYTLGCNLQVMKLSPCQVVRNVSVRPYSCQSRIKLSLRTMFAGNSGNGIHTADNRHVESVNK
jgi:hypothetical protein